MTIRQIYDQIETFSEEQRDTILRALSEKFSKLSMGTLFDFQDTWNPKKGQKAFFQEQARIFKTCIELELGVMGQDVRKMLGLEQLTWETEIANETP